MTAATLPANRFGQWTAGFVSYTQVEPSLVVEVDADMSFEHTAGSIRIGSSRNYGEHGSYPSDRRSPAGLA